MVYTDTIGAPDVMSQHVICHNHCYIPTTYMIKFVGYIIESGYVGKTYFLRPGHIHKGVMNTVLHVPFKHPRC